jgi:hypothetical protein
LSAVAADPVLIALVAALASGGVAEWKANVVPATIAVVSALLVALAALLLGYSDAWRARVQTPITKAVVTAIEKFVAVLVTIQIATLNSSTLYSLGDKLLGALGGAIVAGILSFALNRAQEGPPLDRAAKA